MTRKQAFSERAKKILDDFELKLNYSLGEGQSTPTIFMNAVQAKRLNWGLEQDTRTHESYLFLVTVNSEAIGPVLREQEFGCDFLLLKFETPISQAKWLDEPKSSDAGTSELKGKDVF